MSRASKYGPPHSGMMPKAQYMKLSKAERAAFRASIGFTQAPKGATRGRRLAGKGDYRNFIRGKGDFFDDIAGYGTKLIAGGARAIAKRAGQFISGRGAYKRNFVRGKGDYMAPGTLAPPSVPLMASAGRSNVFTYREYLGDVYSSVDFANTVFNINPGLGDPGNPIPTMAGLFPWLSGTAQKYEQYRVEQAIMEFISTSSDAVVSGATTSSLGQVCIATQYNTNLASFTNLTDALNSQFATTAKPSDCFSHPIECAPRERTQNVQYVRSQPLSGSQDILQYDMGQVNLITQGMPADGEVIGQLWISYKVSVFKPILLNEGGPSVRYAHYTYQNANSDVAASTLFGTRAANMQPTASTTMLCTFDTASNKVTLAPDVTTGFFEITTMWTGASNTSGVTGNAVTAGTNCSLVSLLDGGLTAGIVYPPGSSSTTTRCGNVSFIKVTGPSATFTYSNPSLPSSINYVDFVLTELNNNVSLLREEKKFGNFYRPRKGMSTAPWLRGKYIHDRTKAPRRHTDYKELSLDQEDSAEFESDEEDDFEQMEKFMALKRVFAKKHAKQPKLRTEEPAEGKEEHKQELPPPGGSVVVVRSQSAKGTKTK